MVIDLASGLTLAKGVVDLAKGLKDLSEGSENLDIRDAAVELRSKSIDLKETVNEMRDMIIQLEEQLEFKEKLDWNGQTFEYTKENRKIYIFNGCEAQSKHVHMSETRTQRGYHSAKCPVCNNQVIFNAGAPMEVRDRGENCYIQDEELW